MDYHLAREAIQLWNRENPTKLVRTKRTYAKYHKKISCELPCTPHRAYKASGWTGYSDFLQKPKFCTYHEAREAIKQWNLTQHTIIDTNNLYDKWYKAISFLSKKRLPSRPHIMYSEWQSWDVFLRPNCIKSYPNATYQQTIEAIINWNKFHPLEKVNKRTSYHKLYKEISKFNEIRLYSYPDEKFVGAGWISWTVMFESVIQNSKSM